MMTEKALEVANILTETQVYYLINSCFLFLLVLLCFTRIVTLYIIKVLSYHLLIFFRRCSYESRCIKTTFVLTFSYICNDRMAI
jgi:hypothetical protein